MANMASSELNGDRNLFPQRLLLRSGRARPHLLSSSSTFSLHTFDQLVFTSPSEAVVDMSSRS